MVPFKHILVPTDFEEPAIHALDFAVTLAAKFETKLTLFHAIWLPPSPYLAHADRLYWPTDEMGKEAEAAKLNVAVSNLKARYANCEGIMVTGEPCQAILEAVKKHGADLIVMGTHGRRALTRLLLGSVAEKIVRLSPVPVVTVAGGTEAQTRKETEPPSPAASSDQPSS
jgi:nucleotide-binding universal stress UspA family protein